MRTLAYTIALFALACGSSPTRTPTATPAPAPERHGVYYTVQPGDTLNAIALLQGVEPEQIVAANAIEDPDVIEIGQRLFLPGLDALVVTRDAGPGLGMVWPVDRVRLTSFYGARWGREHKGIDLGGPIGTPIRAAAKGVVTYSDNKQRGYGNLVIIKHPGGFETRYAHNHRNRVDEGQAVRQGQLIAELGRTGRSTGPHLHFELRHEGKAIDPMDFLPAVPEKKQ